MNKNHPSERRHYIRIEKHFFISYCNQGDPEEKHSISQLKNISLGGMCFIASEALQPSARLIVDLKTPYLAGTVQVEGIVVQSDEKIPNMIYETHFAFDKIPQQAEVILNHIIDAFFRLTQEKDKK